MVTRSKVNGAFIEYKKQRIENSKAWKQCRNDIPAGRIRDAYNGIWKKFMEKYKCEVIANSERKVG